MHDPQVDPSEIVNVHRLMWHFEAPTKYSSTHEPDAHSPAPTNALTRSTT